jgi:hypothetical protein
MHCQDIRMKCIPDVYCPMKVHKKCRTNRSAKDLKFYICEGILADIFYLSGSTHDLYAQQVYKNVNHLKSVSQHYLQILRQILDPYSILIPARQSVHHIAKVVRLYLIDR